MHDVYDLAYALPRSGFQFLHEKVSVKNLYKFKLLSLQRHIEQHLPSLPSNKETIAYDYPHLNNMQLSAIFIGLIASVAASPTALQARAFGGPASTGEVCM